MSKFINLTAFISVVQHKSFAKAAKDLKLSPSTITRRINELEAELKMLLIQRTSQAFSLTEFGEAFYPEALQLLKHLEALEGLVSIYTQELVGELEIAVPKYFFDNFIVMHLAEFYRLNPKLKLNFSLQEKFPDLELKSYDLMIAYSDINFDEEKYASLVRRKLFSSRFVICASPNYIPSYMVTEANLAQLNLISHSGRINPRQIKLIQQNLNLHSNLMVSSNDSLVRAAKAGLGIIQLHDFFVKEEIKVGVLLEILKHQAPTYNYYIYYHKERYLNKKVKTFLDYFLAHLIPQKPACTCILKLIQ